jgi:hypothetical protein
VQGDYGYDMLARFEYRQRISVCLSCILFNRVEKEIYPAGGKLLAGIVLQKQ